MTHKAKLGVVIALAAGVAVVVAIKANRPGDESRGRPTATRPAGVPLLMEFGAGQCDACRNMEVVLGDLESQCKDRLEIRIVNITNEPAVAEKHHVQQIPTQIFFDPSGKELDRHTGFKSVADILDWAKELGYDLAAPPSPGR